MVLCCLAGAQAAEIATGAQFHVVELVFRGPLQTAAEEPSANIDFYARFRHESGEPTYRVQGFWDGDGKGSDRGRVFRIRFTPTKAGRWDLIEVHSNRPELEAQHEGDYVEVVASSSPGFWRVDPASAGRRWYMRSDGSHPYVLGNTHYDFLRTRSTQGIRSDVIANAFYFTKLRTMAEGEVRFDHPPAAGTYPAVRFYEAKVDVAVETAYAHDLAIDLILRKDLYQRYGSGYLEYIAARYGSFPNVWITLANEWNIKGALRPSRVREAGRILERYLPYSTPLGIHPDHGWDVRLRTSPPWNDHKIIQGKVRRLARSADQIRENYARPPANLPVVNDELSYQGVGDEHRKADTIEAHLGAFAGGGYGSTGFKPASRSGQYFFGAFDPAAHSAADSLRWMREVIETKLTFWRLSPVGPARQSIFTGAPSDFQALEWKGREYVLVSNSAKSGITATLPAGQWSVVQFDILAQQESRLREDASGDYVFSTPASRALITQFRRTDPAPVVSFTDVWGDLPQTNGGHGVMWADADGDGRPEAYLPLNRKDQGDRPDLLLHNEGHGRFREMGAAWGVDDPDRGSHGAVWADLDNDGDYDLINGTTFAALGQTRRNEIFRNDAPGRFSRVLRLPRDEATRSVLATDLDGDGDLDIFCVSGYLGEGDPRTEKNEVYLNEGNFVFREIVSGTLHDLRAGQGAVDTDFDGDGDIDILAANARGQIEIARNEGGGVFRKIPATRAGLASAEGTAGDGVSSADLDNDGDLDLVLSRNDSGRLFFNDGNGHFRAGPLFEKTHGYMAAIGDLDNDGDQDLIFAGDETIYLNDGNGSFAAGGRLPALGSDPRGIALADFDGDGDLDVAVGVKSGRSALLRNDLRGGGHWLKIALTAPSGQAGAFGAKLYVSDPGGRLLAMREVKSNSGYLAQDDPVVHVGLGSRTRVTLTVRFPDGQVAVVRDVAPDRLVRITGATARLSGSSVAW